MVSVVSFVHDSCPAKLKVDWYQVSKIHCLSK